MRQVTKPGLLVQTFNRILLYDVQILICELDLKSELLISPGLVLLKKIIMKEERDKPTRAVVSLSLRQEKL